MYSNENSESLEKEDENELSNSEKSKLKTEETEGKIESVKGVTQILGGVALFAFIAIFGITTMPFSLIFAGSGLALLLKGGYDLAKGQIKMNEYQDTTKPKQEKNSTKTREQNMSREQNLTREIQQTKQLEGKERENIISISKNNPKALVTLMENNEKIRKEILNTPEVTKSLKDNSSFLEVTTDKYLSEIKNNDGLVKKIIKTPELSDSLLQPQNAEFMQSALKNEKMNDAFLENIKLTERVKEDEKLKDGFYSNIELVSKISEKEEQKKNENQMIERNEKSKEKESEIKEDIQEKKIPVPNESTIKMTLPKSKNEGMINSEIFIPKYEETIPEDERERITKEDYDVLTKSIINTEDPNKKGEKLSFEGKGMAVFNVIKDSITGFGLCIDEGTKEKKEKLFSSSAKIISDEKIDIKTKEEFLDVEYNDKEGYFYDEDKEKKLIEENLKNIENKNYSSRKSEIKGISLVSSSNKPNQSKLTMNRTEMNKNNNTKNSCIASNPILKNKYLENKSILTLCKK